jgi:hypothetical protein
MSLFSLIWKTLVWWVGNDSSCNYKIAVLCRADNPFNHELIELENCFVSDTFITHLYTAERRSGVIAECFFIRTSNHCHNGAKWFYFGGNSI